MLLLDREAALAAISKLLPENMDQRRKSFAARSGGSVANTKISGVAAKRVKQMAGLFGLEGNTVPFDPKARAS